MPLESLPPSPLRLLKKVPEASYLVAENARRYRPIMRHFYTQHSLHRYSLTADEVREFVRAQVDPGYSEEMAEQDLRQLVEWGNLKAEQDRARVRTVEEWLRRRLRYQITPYGIAFERLLTELEQAHGGGGSLDPSHLEYLWERLVALDQALAPGAGDRQGQEELARVRRLWAEAYRAFDQIGKDAADYLAAMQGARPQDLNEEAAFLAYKDVLLQYLGSFINSLLDHVERIRALLGGWAARGLFPLLVETLVRHDTRYLPDPSGRLPEAEVVRAHYQQQAEALADWFRRKGGADLLRAQTVDAIETVVRHSHRLMERGRFGMGRRRELEHLLRAFAGCRTLEAAGRLAGAAFGCGAPRHLLGSLEAYTLAERGSVWAAAPQEVPLGKVQRGRQVRARSAPVPDVTLAQQAVLVQELERRRAEAALWDQLFAAGDVNLGRLTLADTALRQRLLEVVSRCLAAPDRVAVAADGSRIRLLPPAGPGAGELGAPDGVLLTPQFILRRERPGGEPL